jgi:hypothetical protein
MSIVTTEPISPQTIHGNHRRVRTFGAWYEITPEFQRGWDAALLAVRQWHEAQSSKTLVQARHSRFPKNYEREAEVHRKSAELIGTLSPDDV